MSSGGQKEPKYKRIHVITFNIFFYFTLPFSFPLTSAEACWCAMISATFFSMHVVQITHESQ
jgi:hypothetical protein